MEIIELMVLIPSFPPYFRLLAISCFISLFLHSSWFSNYTYLTDLLCLHKLMLPTFHYWGRIHQYCIEELYNGLPVKLHFLLFLFCISGSYFLTGPAIDILSCTIKEKITTTTFNHSVRVMVFRAPYLMERHNHWGPYRFVILWGVLDILWFHCAKKIF